MVVMGSPHGLDVFRKNKLTMFGAHCPVNSLTQLAESKDNDNAGNHSVRCVKNIFEMVDLLFTFYGYVHRFSSYIT